MDLGRSLLFKIRDSNCEFRTIKETENIPSIKSFLSCGFKQIYEDKENCRVLINISDLKKPEFVKGVVV